MVSDGGGFPDFSLDTPGACLRPRKMYQYL